MRSQKTSILPIALALIASMCPTAKAQSAWQVTRTLHIGGEGGWDYLTVESRTSHLFIPRGTHTMVVDENGKTVADIPGQKHNHGVALVPQVNRGFVTDGGGSGSIVVFDLQSYQVLGSIPALPDADGIIYDAHANVVLAVSGDESTLMAIKPDVDPKTGTVEKIPLGGKPESLGTDGSGKVYVNLEDKDTVAVVDLAKKAVIARWPVTPGGHPVGMAVDPASHTIFVGCRNPARLVAIDTQSGKVTSDIPIGTGVDATLFDNGHAFASTGDGNLTIASVRAGKLTLAQTLKTSTGARTMGIDTSNHRIFLPTAEMESGSAPGGRPRPKPGSFMIVVAEPK